MVLICAKSIKWNVTCPAHFVLGPQLILKNDVIAKCFELFKLKSFFFYFNSQRYEKTIQNCDWTLGNILQNIVWHAFPWTQGWSRPICLPKSYIADTWFVVFPAFVQTNMYLMWCCDQGFVLGEILVTEKKSGCQSYNRLFCKKLHKVAIFQGGTISGCEI